MRAFLSAMMMLTIAGCAGVGVVKTSDPTRKLSDAYHLAYEQDRPLIAERLIVEAKAISEKDNDLLRVGHALRNYGDLLRSHAIATHENYYRQNGFLDKAVSYDTRMEHSERYFRKALEVYIQAEKGLLADGKYDALSNLYFNTAYVLCELEHCDRSCEYFDKAIAAHEKNVELNPAKSQFHGDQFESVLEQFRAAKTKAGCV